MTMRQHAVVEYQVELAKASLERPNNTTAYDPGDIIADANGNILEFEGVTSAIGPHTTGYVDCARLISSANNTPADMELWLFNKKPTTGADNTALALSDSDVADHLVGIIEFEDTDFKVSNAASGASGNMVAELRNASLPFVAPARKLWGVIVPRGAYTPVANETFTVHLVVYQD